MGFLEYPECLSYFSIIKSFERPQDRDRRWLPWCVFPVWAATNAHCIVYSTQFFAQIRISFFINVQCRLSWYYGIYRLPWNYGCVILAQPQISEAVRCSNKWRLIYHIYTTPQQLKVPITVLGSTRSREMELHDRAFTFAVPCVWMEIGDKLSRLGSGSS